MEKSKIQILVALRAFYKFSAFAARRKGGREGKKKSNSNAFHMNFKFCSLVYIGGQLVGGRGITGLDQYMLKANQTPACTITREVVLRNPLLKTTSTIKRLSIACK